MQVNKYRIVFSKLYEKWQVKRRDLHGWITLEEFANKESAINFARNN